MTERKMAELITAMQAIYPDSFRDKSDELIRATIRTWAKIFADDDYEVVSAAIYAHMATSTDKWMPQPGIIKQRIVQIKTGLASELTAIEAWQLVSKATRNSGYHAKEEFDKLPPLVQRLVGSPNQLREWGMMEAETVESVVASNFQRSYNVRAIHEREQMALPSALKETLNKLSGSLSMALPDAKERNKG